MSERKRTPGPWCWIWHFPNDWKLIHSFEADAHPLRMVDEVGETWRDEDLPSGAVVWDDLSPPTAEDARLIASAPTLLAACESALRMLEGDGGDPDTVRQELCRAIERATAGA